MLEPPPYTYNLAPKIRSEENLLQALSLTPREVVQQLGMEEGPTGEHLLSMAARFGGLARHAKELCLSELLGVTSEKFALPQEGSIVKPFNFKRYYLEQCGTTEFRVRAERLLNPGADGLFPATFVELPIYLMGAPREMDADFMLVMKLSAREMAEVRKDLSPGLTHLVSDAFASSKFAVLENGEIVINTFASRIYNRLRSEELKEKYKNWPAMLLNGIEFVTRARGVSRLPAMGKEQQGRPIAPRMISIYSLKHDMTDLKRTLTTLLREELESSDDPAAFLMQYMEELSNVRDLMQENHLVSEIAVSQCGFRSEWCPVVSAATRETLTTVCGQLLTGHRVVKPIAPLSREDFFDSGDRLVDMFEVTRSHRDRDFFSQLDRVLPADIFDAAAWHGVRLTHPVSPAGFFDRGMSKVREHFALAPGEPFNPDLMFEFVGAREQAVFLQELASPEAVYVAGKIGRDFIPVSKAVARKPQQDWWRIGNGSESRISITHLRDQNRHPYIRFELAASEAEMLGTRKRFVVGIKGGGYCSRGISELALPNDGFKIPIACNLAKNPSVDGLTPSEHPAPFPRIWGGDNLMSAIRELSYTEALRTFLKETEPELLSMVPQPINASRFLSVPRWKKGETEWISVDRWIHEYLRGGSVDPVELGAYISIQNCDVRIRQLYERIFVRGEKSSQNYERAGHEVASALRSFFYWNDEDTDVRVADEIARLPTLTVSELLKILHEEYKRNPERAERVFAKTAGRLAAMAGHVHGYGGHFGGGFRKIDKKETMGICWGGPLGMRNIDLTGGLHDLDMASMYFPWSSKEHGDPENRIIERAEFNRSRAYDLMYLAEAVSWLEVILRGRENPMLGTSPTLKLSEGPFNDITVLNDLDRDSPADALQNHWIPHVVKSPEGYTEKTVAPGALLGDDIWGCYFEALDKAREKIAQTGTHAPII